MSTARIEDRNVDLIELPDKKIYLVGTAHISSRSADLAEEVIREVAPDAVAVELCSSRYQAIKDPDRWKNTDIIAVLKSGRHYVLLAQLIMAGYQKRLGASVQTAPGAEMLRAIAVAEELNADVVLADRDVKTTLKRVWSALGFRSTVKVMAAMISGLFAADAVTKEEIENLKSDGVIDDMMNAFSEAFPGVRIPLIDERDQYLAAKIQEAPGRTIVAIVGAGHARGIKEWLSRDERIETAALETVPAPKKSTKILAWGIPALVTGMMIYALFASGAETTMDMVKAWFWINGSFGALGALAALGHPLTILAAFVAAPFTSLHPLIASGWVAGLVEAMLRKPQVKDLEALADDVGAIKGFWKNRVLRILLVIALTNLFGTIGVFIGMGRLAALL